VFRADMVLRYSCYYILQFINNVSTCIIKTRVLLPQEHVTLAEFGYPI
jgi:hypothetical protein